MFLLLFFLCSCFSSSYILAPLLLTFSLFFFLHSRFSSSYVLARLTLLAGSSWTPTADYIPDERASKRGKHAEKHAE